MGETSRIQIGIPTPQDFVPLEREIDQVPVTALLTKWSQKKPDKLALVSQGRTYSYGELNSNVNKLANGLLQVLGEKEEPVGILLGKDSSAIISLLATLKAGKFYGGLDPENPTTFLRTICDDLEPRAILTDHEHIHIANEIAKKGTHVLNVEDWASDSPVGEPEIKISLNLKAGVYFTSGSTGKSKGVMVDHKGLWHRTYSSIMSLKYSGSDRTCLPFPIGFGWSTTPLFGTLVTGGALFQYDYNEKSILDVADWLVKQGITNAPMPATFFRQFISLLPDTFGSGFPDMRFIFVGGDFLHYDDLKSWEGRFSTNCTLCYGFSSTEAGPITRSYYRPNMRITDNRLTFGMPAPGVEIFISDKLGNLVSPGITGEIVIRSGGVMNGYWKRDSLNRSIFLDDPAYPGDKLLLTGDMGRKDDQNTLEFLGRKDSQVKIRGYRVDISNISMVINNLSIINDAVVVPYKRKNGEIRLAAYLILKQNNKSSTQQIRKLLASELPSFMIPTYFCVLDELPRNAHGKINTYKLPKPIGERPALETEYVPPNTELQNQITAIWRKILELDEVGVNDNFFELGGDSLMVLEMTLDVEKVFSRSVPQSFFKTPTVSHLAELLTDDTREGKESDQFVLESFRKNSESQDDQYARYSKKRKWLSREYSLKDLDLLLDMIVGHYLVRKPYLEAQEWALKWSQNRRVQRILYQRRAVLFSRWLTLLELEQPHSSDIFGMSIFANLWNRMPRPWKNNRDPKKEMQKYLQSRYPYWRTLGEMIEAVPYGELSEQFPMRGLENLMSAYQKGRGVILVSFHGMPRASGFIPLQRVLRIDDIPTISYLIPIRQSRYQGKRDQMSASTAATLNAEIAMFGQRRLLDGGLIHFVSDRSDTMGRTYKVDIGNRIYEVKGGFAELALNTGASVIPFVRYYLPEGRVQMEFNAPLDLGEGERYERVEGMVREYGAFIERSRKAHPEAMSWNWLKGYLALSIR
jgi:acyl-coenzyme A synthetase/AMP-(fatty) acid ligase/acyl carrier protein